MQGTGEVTFARRQDAQSAIEEYDGRKVDERIIRVRMLGSKVIANELSESSHIPERLAAPTNAPARGRGSQVSSAGILTGDAHAALHAAPAVREIEQRATT